MFLRTLNQAINRYLFQIEDRHEELESPSERTANDAADFFHGVAELSIAAAGVAPGKRVPRPIEAISHNADIATELARRAAARGRIGTTPQAFGSRAHRYFERLNKRLNRTLIARDSKFRIDAEQFRDAFGRVVARNEPGSIAADAVITNLNDARYIEVLDLKTYGSGLRRAVPPSRQLEFQTRFGTRAQEVYRER